MQTSTQTAPVHSPTSASSSATAGGRWPWWASIGVALAGATLWSPRAAHAQTTYQATSSGTWGASSTWKNGSIPASNASSKVEISTPDLVLDLNGNPDADAMPTDLTLGSLKLTTGGQATLTDLNPGGQVLYVGKLSAVTGGVLVLSDQIQIAMGNMEFHDDGTGGTIELAATLSDDFLSNDPTTANLKVSGGTVRFSGDSSGVSGTLTLEAGNAVLASDSLGFGRIVIKGGAFSADDSPNGRIVASDVSLLGDLNGDVRLGSEAGGSLLIEGNTVDLGGGAAKQLLIAGTVEFGAEVTDGGGSAALVKAGDGRLILSSANSSYSGGTEVRAGILETRVDNALGLADPSQPNGPGAKLLVSGGTLEIGETIQTVTGLEIRGGSIMAKAGSPGSIVVDQTGGEILVGGALSSEVSAILAEGGAGPVKFRKTGSGSVQLNAANTFTGGALVEEGLVILGSDQALGTGAVALKGGTLTSDANTREINNDVSITGDVQLGTVASGTLKFAGTTDLGGGRRELTVIGTTELGGVVANGGANAGTLVKKGAGTLTLMEEGTYSGGTVVQNGVLNAYKDGALGSGSLALEDGVVWLANTKQTVAGVTLKGGSLLGDGNVLAISNPGNASSFLAADVASNALLTASIDDGANTTVGVHKTGAGTLILSGLSTFTGDTRIEQGKVVLDAIETQDNRGPLGNPTTGAVILAGGALVAQDNSTHIITVQKPIRAVAAASESGLGSNLGVLSVGAVTVESKASLNVRGNVTAGPLQVDGTLVLSGSEPLKASSIQSGQTAVIVWNRVPSPTASQTPVGISITTPTTQTDLRSAKITVGSEALAVARTQANHSTVGTLIESEAVIQAPSDVIQVGGGVKFRLVEVAASSNGSKNHVDLVMDRAAYETLLPSNNVSGFASVLNNAAPGSTLDKVLSDLTDPARNLSSAELSKALSQLDAGHTYSAMSSLSARHAMTVAAPLDSHLDTLAGSSVGGGGTAMSMGVKVSSSKNVAPVHGSPITPSSQNNWTAWFSGYGSWNQISADSANGYGKAHASDAGGMLGLEHQMGDARAGVTFVLGESLSSSDPGMRVRTDHWAVGGYGSVSIGVVTLDASVMYGQSNHASRRELPLVPETTANYQSDDWQMGVGVSVNLAPAGSSWQFTPVARMKYVTTAQDGFTESGALGASTPGMHSERWISQTGLRIAHQSKPTNSIALGVDAGAYWVHDYNSGGRNMNFEVAGISYTVRGRDADQDQVRLNLGLQATFSDSVILRLSGQQDIAQWHKQTTGVFSVGLNF